MVVNTLVKDLRKKARGWNTEHMIKTSQKKGELVKALKDRSEDIPPPMKKGPTKKTKKALGQLKGVQKKIKSSKVWD
jgi:hypothetical protein